MERVNIVKINFILKLKKNIIKNEKHRNIDL